MPAFSSSVSLAVYFCLNLFVTLSNKALLRQVSQAPSNTSSTAIQQLTQFSRPYFLTCFHALGSFTGSTILLSLPPPWTFNLNSTQCLPRPSLRVHLTLLAFSTLYTFNIALSNISLHLVSLPLHQTIRALAPALTIPLG